MGIQSHSNTNNPSCIIQLDTVLQMTSDDDIVYKLTLFHLKTVQKFNNTSKYAYWPTLT